MTFAQTKQDYMWTTCRKNIHRSKKLWIRLCIWTDQTRIYVTPCRMNVCRSRKLWIKLYIWTDQTRLSVIPYRKKIHRSQKGMDIYVRYDWDKYYPCMDKRDQLEWRIRSESWKPNKYWINWIKKDVCYAWDICKKVTLV